ncbi:MAG: hypothetical protein AVDCRST_MAG37-2438, partial [uncultured Rubrobacteraceae bacterium]
ERLVISPRYAKLVLIHRAFRLLRDGAHLRPRRAVDAGNIVVCVGLDLRGS